MRTERKAGIEDGVRSGRPGYTASPSQALGEVETSHQVTSFTLSISHPVLTSGAVLSQMARRVPPHRHLWKSRAAPGSTLEWGVGHCRASEEKATAKGPGPGGAEGAHPLSQGLCHTTHPKSLPRGPEIPLMTYAGPSKTVCV